MHSGYIYCIECKCLCVMYQIVCIYVVSPALTDEFILQFLQTFRWLLEYSFHSEWHHQVTRQSVCPLKPIINDCTTWHSTVHSNRVADHPKCQLYPGK